MLWEVPPSSDEFNAELDASGVESVIMPAQGRYLRYIWNVYRWVRKNRVDILHTHFNPSSFLALIAARLARTPMPVLSVRSGVSDWVIRNRLNFKSRTIIRLCIAMAKRAFCVSQATKDSFTRCGLGGEKLEVRYVGIESAISTRTRQDVRVEFGLAENDAVIVTTAFHGPVKGNDVLLKAVARLAPKYPRLRLLQIGGESLPGETAGLKTLSQELEIADHIVWAGLRNDVRDILIAGDVYCQPSRSEGLPSAVIEAVEAGLPVVASDVGGIPEIVTDDCSGVLVAPERPDLLAEGLGRFLEKGVGSETTAERARQMVRTKFNLERQTEKLVDMYEEMLP